MSTTRKTRIEYDEDCPAIIAKVVFSRATSLEIRKFSVQDKDYRQFLALVSESLASQSTPEDTIVFSQEEVQLQYMDVESDWVTFSTEVEWSEAKDMCRCTGAKTLKIKVRVNDDIEIKQHCSLNMRGKKRSTMKRRQSHSSPCFIVPDRQHLTVGFRTLRSKWKS